MKKLWILALLPLLFVFGCSHNEYEIWDTVENFVPLSEQVQQKQNDDFEKKIMCSNMYTNLQNHLAANYKEPNYAQMWDIKEIFYSPTEDSCFWLVDVYYKKYLDTEPKYMTHQIYNILDYTSAFYYVCFENCENEPVSDNLEKYNNVVNYLKWN